MLRRSGRGLARNDSITTTASDRHHSRGILLKTFALLSIPFVGKWRVWIRRATGGQGPVEAMSSPATAQSGSGG